MNLEVILGLGTGILTLLFTILQYIATLKHNKKECQAYKPKDTLR